MKPKWSPGCPHLCCQGIVVSISLAGIDKSTEASTVDAKIQRWTKDQQSLDNTYIHKVLMKGLISVNFTLWGSITATKAQGLFPSRIEGEESRDSYQQLENHHFWQIQFKKISHHPMQSSRFGSSIDKFDTITP